MKAKIETFLNGIWSGVTGLLIGSLTLLNNLISTPKVLIATLVLSGLGYDLVTGGKLGGIAFVTNQLKAVVDMTKDITWQQVIAIGNFSLLGYFVFDRIKK